MSLADAILLIRENGMGSGPQELRLTLLAKYLQLLVQDDQLPAAICAYTEGVKVAVEGSPFLEQLRDLEAHGVRLILCSTCLNFYGLTEKVKVGIVGSMADILEAQNKAAKVITL
jgi:intracellular sulfur oxidation DsrE/DsrF family protein